MKKVKIIYLLVTVFFFNSILNFASVEKKEDKMLRSQTEYIEEIVLSYDELWDLVDSMEGHEEAFRKGNSNILNRYKRPLNRILGVAGLFKRCSYLAYLSFFKDMYDELDEIDRQAWELTMRNGRLAAMSALKDARYFEDECDLFRVEFVMLDRPDIGLKVPQQGGELVAVHYKHGGWKYFRVKKSKLLLSNPIYE